MSSSAFYRYWLTGDDEAWPVVLQVTTIDQSVLSYNWTWLNITRNDLTRSIKHSYFGLYDIFIVKGGCVTKLYPLNEHPTGSVHPRWHFCYVFFFVFFCFFCFFFSRVLSPPVSCSTLECINEALGNIAFPFMGNGEKNKHFVEHHPLKKFASGRATQTIDPPASAPADVYQAYQCPAQTLLSPGSRCQIYQLNKTTVKSECDYRFRRGLFVTSNHTEHNIVKLLILPIPEEPWAAIVRQMRNLLYQRLKISGGHRCRGGDPCGR